MLLTERYDRVAAYGAVDMVALIVVVIVGLERRDARSAFPGRRQKGGGPSVPV